MEFKKCERCGCFFISEDNVCQNCAPKDRFEMSKLKNYFENQNYSNTLNSISVDTGISIKNLNRYFNNDNFSEISNKLDRTNRKAN